MENLSFDEKTKILTSKELKVEIPKEGLGHNLYESLKKHPGKIAQLDIDTGETDSYESLLERSVRCAVSMKNYGLQPADVISICSHNHFDCGATYLAATFLGVINANLDPALPEANIKHLLQLVTPKLLFVSKECEVLVKNIIQDLQPGTKIVVYGDEFSKFIEYNVDVEFKPYICRNLNETIIILFSSGTTGMPKGVCLDHNFILYHTSKPMPLVSFYTTTFYWVTASLIFLTSIRSGSVQALCKNLNHNKLWDRIKQYKIELALMPLYHIMKFIASKPPKHETGLKLLVLAGSGTSKENMLKIKKELPNTQVLLTYGMTELGGIASPSNEISYNKHVSVGLLNANMACKIVNPETEEPLALNQKGEVRIKAKYHLTGFYKESSSNLLDKDGFYKTGDVGYIDDDFCLFVVDRIKLIFKYRNYQIVPGEIEEILVNHPDVQNAAVIPVPHSEDGSHIAAVVEIKQNSNATEASIEKDCNDQLDDIHKIRAGVKIIDVLPLTPTGKIDRTNLKNSIQKLLGN